MCPKTRPKFWNGTRVFEAMAGPRPDLVESTSTQTSSPIPLLHQWLADRFCLNHQLTMQTSCPSKQCLGDWTKSLLLLDGLEDSGFMSQALGQTCSGQEIRLETYYVVCPDSDWFQRYDWYEMCPCIGNSEWSHWPAGNPCNWSITCAGIFAVPRIAIRLRGSGNMDIQSSN